MKERLVLFLLFTLSLFSCKNGNTNDNNKVVLNTDSIQKTINNQTDTLDNSIPISSNEITTSKSNFFTINNLTCYWKFITTFNFSDGKKSDFVNFNLQLIEKKSNKVILSDSDFISSNKIDSVDLRLENFKDINFDGYKDFVNPNQESSGTGGEFYNVHLYNPEKHLFELSKELSNSDLELDSVNRTVSTYWKAGVSLNITNVIHFDKKGKIKFEESFRKEVMNINDDSKLVTTTKKIIGQKTVAIKVDTTSFEGY